MNKNVKKLVKKENAFFKKHSGLITRVGTGLAIGATLLMLASLLKTTYYLPHQTQEFANTSVMIVGKNMRSGGSGVILESTNDKSLILTNNHVCEVVKEGGYVVQENLKYPVDMYAQYAYHDLCVVTVSHSFNVNTKVADSAPTAYSKAFISGHPNLLPHVLTTGSFSKYRVIHVLTGLKKCSETETSVPKDNKIIEKNNDEYWCENYGMIPIFKTYQSQLVTGTILPGSSGSAVYNSNGEISALVFAGHSRGFSYAFVVPYEYVVDFVRSIKYNKVDWLSPGTKDSYDPEWLKKFNLPEAFIGKFQELKNDPKLKEILLNVKKSINSN